MRRDFAAQPQEVQMPKLTDTQLVILNTAAGRDNRAVLPLPKSLKINKGTATSVLKVLLKKGLIEEQPATPRVEAWRQDDAGQRYMLAIADPGIAALESDPGASANKSGAALPQSARQPKPTHKAEVNGAPSKRPGGKLETILELLKRPEGAQLAELEKATGWQPHSVRAALTGLRKRAIAILREKQDGITRYRVAAA
jgi:DNA-binding IclR family transcriptional regulator